MNPRLNIPRYKTDDPLSYFSPKTTTISEAKIQQLRNQWPKLCRLLAELDYHQHPVSSTQQYIDPDPGNVLLKWIEPAPAPPSEPDY